MTFIFRLLCRLPLAMLHALGWAMGWAVFLFSPLYRRRFLANAALAGVSRADRLLAVGECGKLLAELPRLWMGAPVPVYWEGEADLERALAQGRGIVAFTPHMGCFEVVAQAYARRYGVAGAPMTALYRPARKKWLQTLVAHARAQPGLLTAPTTAGGVRQLVRALRSGHCVGVLPDQVPALGQGLWSPFFGQQAYTMTLGARLAVQTGAAVILGWGERLPWGRGYVVHVRALQPLPQTDLQQAVDALNRQIQVLIQEKPSQYLWPYARYKQPRTEP